jgi:hypothetical protein
VSWDSFNDASKKGSVFLAVPNMKPTDELIQGIADLLEWNDACKAAGSQEPAES